MTGQRSGTMALVIVGVVYALLFGGWFIATGLDVPPAPAVLPTATATAVPPTYTPVPPGWQGLIPTAAAAPTPGLLRPPFTLAPEATATP